MKTEQGQEKTTDRLWEVVFLLFKIRPKGGKSRLGRAVSNEWRAGCRHWLKA